MTVAQRSKLVQRVAVNARSLRQDSGLTQEQVADKANISVAMVSLVERGGRAAGLPTLERMAKALKVDASKLFREVV